MPIKMLKKLLLFWKLCVTFEQPLGINNSETNEIWSLPLWQIIQHSVKV